MRKYLIDLYFIYLIYNTYYYFSHVPKSTSISTKMSTDIQNVNPKVAIA